MSLITPIDKFQQLQHAIAGVLDASPIFSQCQVIIYRPRIQPDGTVVDAPGIQRAIEGALAGLITKNDGAGTAAIVMMPALANWKHDAEVPQQTLDVAIKIIENVLVNNSPGGSYRSAESLAAAAMQAVHFYRAGGAAKASQGIMSRDAAPIVPIGNDGNKVVYEVRFFCEFQGFKPIRAATPVIQLSGSTATLSCVTPGASIYYTLDGTFPISTNTEATLYSTPFTVEDGQLLKAVAYKS